MPKECQTTFSSIQTEVGISQQSRLNRLLTPLSFVPCRMHSPAISSTHAIILSPPLQGLMPLYGSSQRPHSFSPACQQLRVQKGISLPVCQKSAIKFHSQLYENDDNFFMNWTNKDSSLAGFAVGWLQTQIWAKWEKFHSDSERNVVRGCYLCRGDVRWMGHKANNYFKYFTFAKSVLSHLKVNTLCLRVIGPVV